MENRVILIVLDSFGVGALPDAKLYGDTGANTMGHIYQQIPGFCLPNMERLGLGNIAGVTGPSRQAQPQGAFGKAAERSAGKDTTVGHWEIAGCISENPLPVYPEGFPEDLITAFEQAVGRKCIGNKPASGTAILEELGEEHCRSGKLIVYTSSDSVFQIAAHEEVVPLQELYQCCQKARELLTAPHNVGRVIARPFTGQPGGFTRTPNRHDYSLEPTGPTVLDQLAARGVPTVGVGKIYDIFAGRAVTHTISITDNLDGVDKTIRMMDEYPQGLIFTNLVDFDMKYGHRRDVQGYADALAAFDTRLPDITGKMAPGDLLVLTADHGCDPAHAGTDHTREYVPILCCGGPVKPGVDLGVRKTFADIGATVVDYLGCGPFPVGTSMLRELGGLTARAQ